MASTTTNRYARHRIEFGHVSDKIHLVCLDYVHAHYEPRGGIENGEEYDREVVCHERDGGPVTVEEHVPGAELE